MKQSEKTILEFAGYCFIHKPELANELNTLIADFINKPKEQLPINGVVKSLPTKRDFILWNAPKNAVKDGFLIDENWIDDDENLHHEVFEDFINWWATQN